MREDTPLLPMAQGPPSRIVDIRNVAPPRSGFRHRPQPFSRIKQPAASPLPPVSYRGIVWHVLHYRSSIQHVTYIQQCSYYVELFLLNLILLNVIVTIVSSSSLEDPAALVHTPLWFKWVIYISTGIFTLEYLLRWWSCVEDPRFKFHPVFGRLKWMLRPMSLIDLVALVPYFLEIALCSASTTSVTYRGSMTIRGLRLLRVISFLRIERSYDAIKRLRIIFRKKRQEFFVVTYLTAVVILISATIIFFLEYPAQPEVFSSIGVGAWWAIETITSLGYGDTVPITVAGRIFASVVALWGIILFAIPGAILGSGFIEVMLEHQTARELRAKDRWIHEISSQLHHIQSVAAGTLLAPLTSLSNVMTNEESQVESLQEELHMPATPPLTASQVGTPQSATSISPYGSDMVSVSTTQINELLQNQEMLSLQIQLQREQLDLVLQLLQSRSEQ
ncbi:Voltage-gated Ion Channel (VIC) Superfamily [Achlya hypogyna]|uniref:Voltage-gated Ion Channel (VIC) Superfamily n=1 Tax=Achlya hypogyna TaxID=1202772 RepID=A0A1V9Z9W0_ACHHY|nr:Voltage-gated Ion Channel (VIC) Superfamily [Achlya hypogyna]